MPRPSRVFFVHPVSPRVNDITGALEYGEARYVNDNYVFPDEIDDERIPDSHLTKMQAAAADFDPDHDLFAIVGDHLQLVLFAGLLMQRHGTMRVLRWDRDAQGYLPVRLAS